MYVEYRPCNANEKFPCSVKKAKDVFRDTEVTLNFSRSFGTFLNSPSAFFLKKQILGRVVASMYMTPGRKRPLLSFFVCKSCDMSEKLRREFEDVYLQECYSFYKEFVDMLDLTSPTYLMVVELLEGKLKSHKIKL